jgi:putative sporulation protein YyaC
VNTLSTNENYVYGVDRINVKASDENASEKIANHLYRLIQASKKKYKEIILLCIGTDRCSGDSYGPLLGTLLTEQGIENIKVIGTLHNPVHAKNLSEAMKSIDVDNSLIIAVDASLGSKVGRITVTNGHMVPGKGVDKDLGKVGDISITGNVNYSVLAQDMNFKVLSSTRLATVWDLVQVTVSAVQQLSVILKNSNIARAV